MGLTKREHIAAMAMQAWISSNHLQGSKKNLIKFSAKTAVETADALIAELERTDKKDHPYGCAPDEA